ncbi:MAG TPA: hypothetical protein VJV74_07200, partial [Terriglobia bacterium]|nr:hypothetical protein [Terriglobia bacterium]
ARTMNEGDGWAGSGSNPWHLDANTESILFLTDESDMPARIGFHVVANGVTYYLTNLKLSPHETRAINIRKLRDAQNTDFLKNTIPAGASDGSVEWNRIDNVAVTGRVVVIQKNQGTASAYDCCMCPCPESYQSLSVTPSSAYLTVGGSVLLTANGAYQACNHGPIDYINDGYWATWTSGSTGIAVMNSGSYGEVDGVAVGTSTITVRYSDYVYTYNGVSCNGSLTPHLIYCIVFVEPTLSCGSVTRGQTTTCSVSTIPSGATFSNWKFTDGTNNVTSSSTGSSWSGIVVRAGTVSVMVTVSGISPTLSASLTVNARSWHTVPASPVEVANGTFYTLPVPPQPTGTDSGLGQFYEQTGDQGFNYFTVGNGPNTGFTYINTQPSIATVFQYEINPDLENSGSVFSTKQYGNCGFISWSNLLAQTRRHEYNSTTQSHYAFYKNSLNSAPNNPGDFFEQLFAAPGTNPSNWASNVVRPGADSRYNKIGTDSKVEPFPVNDSETGTFLGNINYAPYASCP